MASKQDSESDDDSLVLSDLEDNSKSAKGVASKRKEKAEVKEAVKQEKSVPKVVTYTAGRLTVIIDQV